MDSNTVAVVGIATVGCVAAIAILFGSLRLKTNETGFDLEAANAKAKEDSPKKKGK